MSAGEPRRRPSAGGLVDRRLLARTPAGRRDLSAAVALGAAGSTLIVVQAVLLASVVDRALLHGASVAGLGSRLILLGATVPARAAIVWAAELMALRTAGEVTATMRREVLRHSLALGPTWLAGERAGELSLTATRGVEALGVYVGRYLPQAVSAAVAPLGLLIWISVNDWVSGLALAGMVALVPVAMIAFGREATVRAGAQWGRLSSLSARYLELIQGLPTLRAAGRAALGRREVAASTEGLRAATMSTLRVALLSALAMELIAGLGVGLAAMLLGLRLLHGSLGLGTALAILLVAPEVFVPLRRAGAEFHASTEGQAAAARLWEVLDTPAAGAGRGGFPAAGSAPRAPGRTGAPDLSSMPVSLRALTIDYPGRPAPAVGPVDLVVAPGEHLALVGPSGSGKSSVLAALLGFVTPSGGQILVGDVDLSGIDLRDWRRRIAWVPQRTRLFRGTLLDNVTFGRAGAPTRSIDHAIGATGLDELAGRLPLGLATPVGEGGLTLSAGERQRVAIARAVLRDAPLVLLDEPAAHLHPAAVEQLRRLVGEWAEARTVVVAAHRAEIVRIDRVVELGPGARAAPGGARLL